MDRDRTAPRRGRTRTLQVLLAVAAMAAGAALWWSYEAGLWRPDDLLARRDALRLWAEAEPVVALASFAAVYLVLVSSGLPVGPAMSMLAGYLFGLWPGTATIICAATGGALVVYGLARWSRATALGRRLEARAGPVYQAVQEEIGANALGYLIFVRLVPFFPFFLVNVAAGLLGVRTGTFALATLVGRLPGTMIYVHLGREAGRAARPEDLLSPALLAGLTGLGCLALLPVALRHLRARHRRR